MKFKVTNQFLSPSLFFNDSLSNLSRKKIKVQTEGTTNENKKFIEESFFLKKRMMNKLKKKLQICLIINFGPHIFHFL